MRKFNLLYVFSLVFALALVSCSGEDGADGADGINGINGTNGTNGTDGEDGADGADGANGVGYDELIRFGSITMVLEGTRPDFQVFRDSTAFKFTSVEGSDISFINQLDITNNVHDFDLRRFLSSPDNAFNNSYIDWALTIQDLGEENETVTLANIQIVNYAVVGEDNKYFTLSDSFESGIDGVSEFEFSDIAFNPETNNLTFDYRFIVDGESNDSGNTLNVSGTVDVIVLQEVQGL
ncbi:collagen-like protein [Flagellimonas meridianipacifica]|uniref:Collagen triple helix repeat protein n=1 Tax=Flagellimonas meridianipacifica TaxID=1080225 RepID=A0A2T0MJM0_9FLAO|nr:collagen-like protein [Allomuricauda pacifica]PRX57763.1 hypothetical protein CLV81_1773 [Allomuricauda pacifica]